MFVYYLSLPSESESTTGAPLFAEANSISMTLVLRESETRSGSLLFLPLLQFVGAGFWSRNLLVKKLSIRKPGGSFQVRTSNSCFYLLLLTLAFNPESFNLKLSSVHWDALRVLERGAHTDALGKEYRPDQIHCYQIAFYSVGSTVHLDFRFWSSDSVRQTVWLSMNTAVFNSFITKVLYNKTVLLHTVCQVERKKGRSQRLRNHKTLWKKFETKKFNISFDRHQIWNLREQNTFLRFPKDFKFISSPL